MFTRLSEALAASRAKRTENDKGVTLIELLVVVLIIGVLSAIAIPIFIGQQNGAKDAAAKSDLANSKTAVIAYAAANNGTFPASSSAPGASALADYGFISSVTFVSYGSTFCLTRTGATAWSIGPSTTGAVNNATCA